MKALIALFVVLLTLAAYLHHQNQAITPYPANHAATQSSIRAAARFRVETATKDAVLLSGTATDMELTKMPLPCQENERDYLGGDADNFSPNTQFYGISGSGLGTYEGTPRSLIHFASIIDTVSGRKMKLHVYLASSKGFINRSALGWSGDYLPGIRAAARMYGRQISEGSYDRMTAELHLALPHQPKFQFVFVGYDSEGKQITAFGEQPFTQHSDMLKPKNKNKSAR